LFWAVILSFGVTGFLIKPVLFQWNIWIACKISFSLVVGSILYMWFSELITEEGLGNGSSLFIFINIAGDLPNRGFQLSFRGLALYLAMFLIVSSLQGAYKQIVLISAKNLNSNRSRPTKFTGSDQGSIPFKLNQGGITPLIFSSSVAPLVLNLLQPTRTFLPTLGTGIDLVSFLLSSFTLVFFNCTYTSLVIDFIDLKEKLNGQSFVTADSLESLVTARYFEKICYRLAVISGLFLATLIFFANAINEFFRISSFINLTTLFLLIGVVTETLSQVKGYVVMTRYAD
jgi:preprotein translocase subunit SecY